jgi:hypothetical protein
MRSAERVPMPKLPPHDVSSGNVFADLGLPNADDLLLMLTAHWMRKWCGTTVSFCSRNRATSFAVECEFGLSFGF